MKKLIRRIPVIKKYVDIVVTIDDYNDDNPIAASQYTEARTFQPSIRKRFKISDEASGLYTEFLNGVIRTILRHGLKISKQYQSKKAYTYYIQVDHKGFIEDLEVKYEIVFRISDHINPTLDKDPEFTSSDEIIIPVIKNIQLGRFDKEVYNKAMCHLDILCKGIQEDDEKVLVTENKYFK